MRIYLDNAATTPVSKEVLEVMIPFFTDFHGNPSSIHADGRKARTSIEEARKTIAGHLNCSIGEIFFTSGGTESSNMALRCSVEDLGVKRIISSPLEHHCVLHTLQKLEKKKGITIDFPEFHSNGHLNLDHLEELIKKDPKNTLVSLMHANNEIGNLLDLKKVAEICKEYGVLFHSDTVQTVGYFPIDLAEIPISFITGSAHKFHGPKGTGFIYINSGNQISPFLEGGSQERNMRPGTENVAGVSGMAKAFDLACSQMETRKEKISALKFHMMEELRNSIPDIQFNGDPEGESHYKVLSTSFPSNEKTDLLVFSLDIEGISASGGSACSSGVESGSHVLSALKPDDMRKTVRFSFSHYNTIREVDTVVGKLKKILDLRS